METKQSIRTRVLSIRNGLSDEEWNEGSALIEQRLYETKAWKNAKIILLYRDYKNEVKTTGIFKQALLENKAVAFPKVHENDMDFFTVNSMDDLKEGYKGIFEPQNCEKTDLSLYGPHEILMILPGSAFDRQGNRIGYGKGFYDRYIKNSPAMNKMGLAFDFQVIDAIPAEPFDIPVDMIITNKETIIKGKENDGF